MANTIKITETIKAQQQRVFRAMITPEDIMQWYRAGEGWTTPHAIVDARVGGKLKIGFRDPDGKNSYEYEGVYTEINEPNKIVYNIIDDRKVNIDFTYMDNTTEINLEFEMDSVHSEEEQRQGWTSQLLNLKHYLED